MRKTLACLAIFCIPIQATLAWTISSNFDNGSVGQKAERGVDSFTGAAGKSTYSNEEKLKGNAAKISIAAGETGYGNWGGEYVFPEKVYRGGTVWFRVHTYMPSSFDYHAYSAGNRLKFLRFSTLTATGANSGYDDIYFDMLGASNPFIFYYEGGYQNVVEFGGKQDFPVKDTWESYEMAVTFDTVSVDSGGKGLVRIWKNGKLLKQITNRITLQYADGYCNRALLFTYWNGGAPKDQSMYVDEIVVTNETPSNVDANNNPYVGSLVPLRPKNPN